MRVLLAAMVLALAASPALAQAKSCEELKSEIDGRVYLPAGKGAKKLKPGDVIGARVTKADEYDLWAEPVGGVASAA